MAKKKVLVNWEAHEYIPHEKNKAWYVVMALVALALVGLAIWQQQWIFMVLVIVGVAALLTYVIRPPRVLHYGLDEKGLTEGNNLYAFEDFRSFGVMNENNHYSIVLVPKKRFSSSVTVYFPEASGEEIVDIFGAHLPMEPVRLDLIDRIVKLLRI